MKNSLFVFLTLLLITACKPKVPEQYIQPDEMEDLLYDFHLAQAMAKEDRDGNMEFNKSKYFYAVLKKHGVTEADYDSSMVYYFSHLDRLQKVYKGVSERLSDEAKMLGAAVGEIGRYSQLSTSGDTANIWSDRTDLILMPFPTMNRYDFTVKVDTSFHKGDSFTFQFITEYLWQGGMKDAVVCIATKYEGDSIIQTSNHVSVSGLSQIRIPANNENKMKEMCGFIYLTSGSENDVNNRRMMFINQIQLIRFHNKETNETSNRNIQADSLQRIDRPGGAAFDSLRRRTEKRNTISALSAQ